MKAILLGSVFCLLLALQSALAAETAAPGKDGDEGMKLAEEILLREDKSEELPAKEEKAKEKKSEEASELPLMAKEPEATPEAESESETDASEELGEAPAPLPEPGSLKYEMATVDLLADPEPSHLEALGEEIAKR
jgi:hypothetical protein